MADTTRSSSSNSSRTDSSDSGPGSGQEFDRAASVSAVKNQLQESVIYIEDPDLRAEVREWLREADQLPAGSLSEYLEMEIAKIQDRDYDQDGAEASAARPYEMRRTGSKPGHREFPDACDGCEHYGVRCPIFNDPTENTRRQMLKESLKGATREEVRAKYNEFARYNGCARIREFIRKFDEQYREVIDTGWQLYDRVDERVSLGRTSEAAEVQETIEEIDSRIGDANGAGGGGTP